MASFNDFLITKVLYLSPSDSDNKISIHEGLLKARCPMLHSACTKDYKERDDDCYKFEDTCEGTLLRFVEWAYTKEYRTLKGNHISGQSTKRQDTSQEPASDNLSDTLASQTHGRANAESGEATLGNGAHKGSMTSVLYQHADLYVFAHVYLIKDLAELAFKNVTSLIESQTESKESNDAIIDVIKLICSEVNHEDPSIEWFAKYVAWKIVDLRGHKRYEEIGDIVATRAIKYVLPASRPPWVSWSQTKSTGSLCQCGWRTMKWTCRWCSRSWLHEAESVSVKGKKPKKYSSSQSGKCSNCGSIADMCYCSQCQSVYAVQTDGTIPWNTGDQADHWEADARAY